MVAPLRRVVLCRPENAGWQDVPRAQSWQALSYLHAPVFTQAERQHNSLERLLTEAGAEVNFLPADPNFSLDAVYVHDASLITDHGAILMRMGKDCRRHEPAQHARYFESSGIPLLGEIKAPAMAEAGDIVWLEARTVLVGRGYRTNDAGIAQLGSMLAPFEVEVIAAPLPHGQGPQYCLHLMSLLSLLDEKTVLVDLAWLAVQTVELLQQRGYRFIEIDQSERATLACNVLALGDGKLIALSENAKTNQRLEQHGFQVLAFAGSEIGINGGGGPTCLTRPLLRG